MTVTAEEARVRVGLAQEFGDTFVEDLDVVTEVIKSESGSGKSSLEVRCGGIQGILNVDSDNVKKLHKYFDRTDFTAHLNAEGKILTIYW